MIREPMACFYNRHFRKWHLQINNSLERKSSTLIPHIRYQKLLFLYARCGNKVDLASPTTTMPMPAALDELLLFCSREPGRAARPVRYCSGSSVVTENLGT